MAGKAIVAAASVCAHLAACGGPSWDAAVFPHCSEDASTVTWPSTCSQAAPEALSTLLGTAAAGGVMCETVEAMCFSDVPSARQLHTAEADEHKPLTNNWWINVGLTVALVLASGTMAGE